MTLKKVTIAACALFYGAAFGPEGDRMRAQESTVQDRAGVPSGPTMPPSPDPLLGASPSVPAAMQRYAALRKAYEPGPNAGPERRYANRALLDVLEASNWLQRAETATAKSHAEYVAAFEKQVARLKQIEAFVKTAP
jgi:hypothetical protein